MEDSPLKWRVGPRGQHIEMGIAEMNLVLLLGQLGLTWDFQRERLFPIGTLYDPFVMRALEGIVYSTYSGSRFVLAGTPSGISLSREGGAHQSLVTPGIGIETPGLTYAEPCFARELEWLLLDALARMQAPGRRGALPPALDEADRPGAVRGCGRRASARSGSAPTSSPAASGCASPARARTASCSPPAARSSPRRSQAAELLADEEGVEATVLCLSSPDRLYRDWQARPHRRRCAASRVAAVAPRTARSRPTSAACPSSPSSTARATRSSFVGSALGVRSVPLGVDRFGQTGRQPEVYAEYGIDAAAIATAALVALEPAPPERYV